MGVRLGHPRSKPTFRMLCETVMLRMSCAARCFTHRANRPKALTVRGSVDNNRSTVDFFLVEKQLTLSVN